MTGNVQKETLTTQGPLHAFLITDKIILEHPLVKDERR